jgi:hypothetical protein
MTRDELDRVENKMHDITNQSFVAGLITGVLLCLGFEIIIFILI